MFKCNYYSQVFKWVFTKRTPLQTFSTNFFDSRVKYHPPMNSSPWFRYDGPPHKLNHLNLGQNNQMSFNSGLYNQSSFLDEYNRSPYLLKPPPPPPPLLVNCGELREQHHGTLIEIDGKVVRTRMGRFMELKDKFGVIQLVAPHDGRNPNISRQFSIIPIDSSVTVIGYVKRRPENLINNTLPTGKIEIHVDEIVRINRPKPKSFTNAQNKPNKRPYSTLASNEVLTTKGITSIEYKKSGNSENLIQHFINREDTCGSLQLKDVNKMVKLVGWIDPKRSGKFIQLHDGYGHTQIIIENNELKDAVKNIQETDIVLVNGRVVARPQSHQTISSVTGEIEVYCNSMEVLKPDAPYSGSILEIKSINQHTNNTINSMNIEESGNNENDLRASARSSQKINEFTQRTHTCDELNEKDIGIPVILCGWLEYSRMKRFFTLRDGYGRTQIIIPDNMINEMNIESISYETVLKIEGTVMARPPAMCNPDMKTGNIEVVLDKLEILNSAKLNLPIEVRNFNRARESLRLEYRYIDLRFMDMQKNLRTRSTVLMKIREYLINIAGFIEVETPTLFRRTPGGAQEFIVPTRKSGHFYSLVQSPQQFKQMLMSGAIDRYFQIARCYRDESTRPDRQPEFTQLDIELSFTDRDSIFSLIENTLSYCWPPDKKKITIPFPRKTYDEVMERYGSDKPDTREDFCLINITDLIRQNETLAKKFNDNEFTAYAIPVKETEYKHSNTVLKELCNKIGKDGIGNLIYSRLGKDNLDEWCKNSDVKALTSEIAKKVAEMFQLKKKDSIIIGYGNKRSIQNLMGKIRTGLITHFEESLIIKKRTNDYDFLWVIDFPMFTENELTSKLESTHHPFTAPHNDDMLNISNDNPSIETLRTIRSQAYDLVLNGQEIGGGSIRIHNSKLQRKILKDILKIDHMHLEHLLCALESGCPPHGGIALGLDRFIAILCDARSIRDVIAFPKSLDGKDLLSKAPVPISQDELKMYNITVRDQIGSNKTSKSEGDMIDDKK